MRFPPDRGVRSLLKKGGISAKLFLLMTDCGRFTEKMNIELARGEQALVRLRRIERPTSNDEWKTKTRARISLKELSAYGGSKECSSCPPFYY
ncbi:MAG: hypothetical protein ACNYWU_10300 [Desulfobacterales bacterium]